MSIALLAAVAAYAESAGKLDRSFGHDGRVMLRDAHGEARAVAVGGHHRIVVVGDNNIDFEHHDKAFTVARVLSGGGVEDRFGDHGIVKVPFEADSASATSVAIGRKGAIVVAGTVCSGLEPHLTSCHFGVARLKRNGDIDRGFGDDGRVEIDFPQAFDYVRSVALGARGRIVVGGSDCRSRLHGCDIALATLERDGSFDPQFGEGGKLVASIPRSGDRCRKFFPSGSVQGMALDSRARIVVGAQCERRGKVDIARFRPNGQRDRSFGKGGIVERNLGFWTLAVLAVDSRDRIDVVGDQGATVEVTRLGRKGRLDRSFGKDGTAKIGSAPDRGSSIFRNAVDPRSVAIDSRGRIVVGGQPNSNGLAFARFKRDGRVNRRFGRRGWAIVPGAPVGRGNKYMAWTGTVAIDARDRIVGSGVGARTQFASPHEHFALARLLG